MNPAIIQPARRCNRQSMSLSNRLRVLGAQLVDTCCRHIEAYYLSAYARQPARGPTMLAHLVAMLAYVGLCWPILWEQQKNIVKCRRFDGRRPILGLCWPILGLCWPILGLCWPILGAMLAHLGAMLAHLGAMLAHLEAYVGPS